jgi:hypothetical protein
MANPFNKGLECHEEGSPHAAQSRSLERKATKRAEQIREFRKTKAR